jgi:hypothetical protein
MAKVFAIPFIFLIITFQREQIIQYQSVERCEIADLSIEAQRVKITALTGCTFRRGKFPFGRFNQRFPAFVPGILAVPNGGINSMYAS